MLKSQCHSNSRTCKEDNSIHIQVSTSLDSIMRMMVCYLDKFHKCLTTTTTALQLLLLDLPEFPRIQNQCHLESMVNQHITRKSIFGRHNKRSSILSFNSYWDSKSIIKCQCMEMLPTWD